MLLKILILSLFSVSDGRDRRDKVKMTGKANKDRYNSLVENAKKSP